MTVEALPLEDRRRLFAVLLRMAWADGRLAPDEVSALRGALATLGLTEAGPWRLAARAPSRELPETDDGRTACFVAAAWLAGVDGSIDEPELALLRELAAELRIGDDEADRLLRESASASFAMSSTARESMTAPRWAIDLRAVLSFALAEPGGVH